MKHLKKITKIFTYKLPLKTHTKIPTIHTLKHKDNVDINDIDFSNTFWENLEKCEKCKCIENCKLNEKNTN